MSDFHAMKAGPKLDRIVHKSVYSVHGHPPPPFSTDMNYAWMVVEKIRDELFQLSWSDIDGTWFCTFGQNSGTYELTAPLAICRAALNLLKMK